MSNFGRSLFLFHQALVLLFTVCCTFGVIVPFMFSFEVHTEPVPSRRVVGACCDPTPVHEPLSWEFLFPHQRLLQETLAHRSLPPSAHTPRTLGLRLY